MNIQTITAYALSVGPDTKYTAFSSDAWAKAVEVTILGMGMVFAVLAILWFALWIFKLVFAKDTAQNKKSVKQESAPVSEPVYEEVAAQTDDGELIAVITAAIAAFRATEEDVSEDAVNQFRVVSFKRATKGRAWNSNK